MCPFLNSVCSKRLALGLMRRCSVTAERSPSSVCLSFPMPTRASPGHAAPTRNQTHDAKRRAEKPWRRWYASAKWRAKRKAQLEAEPHCRLCAERGDVTDACIADHIQAHRGNYARFWFGRLQSLCKPCHDGLKQSLERGNRAGCDVSGLPVDPSHPWA